MRWYVETETPGAGTVQAIWLSPIAEQVARTSSHIQAAPLVQNKEDRPRKRVCTMIFLSKRKREKAENGLPFLPSKGHNTSSRRESYKGGHWKKGEQRGCRVVVDVELEGEERL